MEWEIKSFMDFEPSWQNSIDSIKAAEDEYVYSIITINDDIAAFGAIGKIAGDIAQLGVNKKYRNKDIGTYLINDLIHSTKSSKVTVINVNSKNESIIKLLKKFGFENYINQYEMIFPIKLCINST